LPSGRFFAEKREEGLELRFEGKLDLGPEENPGDFFGNLDAGFAGDSGRGCDENPEADFGVDFGADIGEDFGAVRAGNFDPDLGGNLDAPFDENFAFDFGGNLEADFGGNLARSGFEAGCAFGGGFGAAIGIGTVFAFSTFWKCSTS
jgi:hypothetical protein